MEKSIIKLPRLYTSNNITHGQNFELTQAQAHYLKNVMRLEAAAEIRVFNAMHGEWLCAIDNLSKKSAAIKPLEQIRAQSFPKRKLHGFFPIIKKTRMDFLIEKAVELGVSDLHPVLCAHCDNRKLNEARTQAQIIEAAEQSERLDIPTLHGVKPLNSAIANAGYPVFVGIERENCDGIGAQNIFEPECGFIVGPEGGFSDAEVNLLKSHDKVICISLGETILRAETAFLALLCKIR